MSRTEKTKEKGGRFQYLGDDRRGPPLRGLIRRRQVAKGNSRAGCLHGPGKRRLLPFSSPEMKRAATEGASLPMRKQTCRRAHRTFDEHELFDIEKNSGGRFRVKGEDPECIGICNKKSRGI